MTRSSDEAPVWVPVRASWTGTVLAWVAPAAVVASLVGILAALAQRHAIVSAEAAGIGGPFTSSLTGHVLAMVLAGSAAVSVASVLVRARHFLAVGAVLLGAALGPLTLVAAPVRGSLVRSDFNDTVLWWHVVVGAVVVGALTGWTVSVMRYAPASPKRVAQPLQTAIFLSAAVVGFLACLRYPGTGSGAVDVVPLIGWALVGGGLTLAAVLSSGRASLGRLALTAVALAAMFAAYHREGGWPGVAGWEYLGMQSPLVLSMSVALVVLLATPVGALMASAGRAVVRRSGDDPARPGAH